MQQYNENLKAFQLDTCADYHVMTSLFPKIWPSCLSDAVCLKRAETVLKDGELFPDVTTLMISIWLLSN